MARDSKRPGPLREPGRLRGTTDEAASVGPVSILPTDPPNGARGGFVRDMKARPTVYRGIPMRSRLEADFARHLDSWTDASWEYEPTCFADAHGQYLPDFVVTHGGCMTVVYEVKPYLPHYLGDGARPVLARMETVLASAPDAVLSLVLWRYEARMPPASITLMPGDAAWSLSTTEIPDCDAVCWPRRAA